MIGAGVPEFHDRMTRSPQTMTSPWLPTVLVGLAHSVQSTISTGLSGSSMLTSRKPEYVPCTAVFPQKARSELNTPCPGTVLSIGTGFGEKPSGCKFFVYVNVAVAEAALGGTADAVNGTVIPMTSALHAIKSRSLFIEAPFTRTPAVRRGQPMARRTANSGRE